MFDEEDDGFYIDDELNSGPMNWPPDDQNKHGGSNANESNSTSNNNNSSNNTHTITNHSPVGESFVVVHYVPLDDEVPLSFSRSFFSWFLQATPKTWLAGFRLQVIFFLIFPLPFHFFAILETSAGEGARWLWWLVRG